MLMLELGMFSDDFLQVTKIRMDLFPFTLKSQADACDFLLLEVGKMDNMNWKRKFIAILQGSSFHY